MTDADPFIKAVLDCPDDDAPRLVYADWLDERGDHVFCDGSLIVCDSCKRWKVLKKRERRILKDYDQPWLATRVNWFDSWTWKRGFVCRVKTTMDRWLQYGPQIVRQYPLEGVEVSDKWPEPYLVRAEDEPDTSDGYYWQTLDYATADRPFLLKSQILHFLASNRRGSRSTRAREIVGYIHNEHVWYPSAQGAINDLSAACIKWAKQSEPVPAVVS